MDHCQKDAKGIVVKGFDGPCWFSTWTFWQAVLLQGGLQGLQHTRRQFGKGIGLRVFCLWGC